MSDQMRTFQKRLVRTRERVNRALDRAGIAVRKQRAKSKRAKRGFDALFNRRPEPCLFIGGPADGIFYPCDSMYATIHGDPWVPETWNQEIYKRHRIFQIIAHDEGEREYKEIDVFVHIILDPETALDLLLYGETRP